MKMQLYDGGGLRGNIVVFLPFVFPQVFQNNSGIFLVKIVTQIPKFQKWAKYEKMKWKENRHTAQVRFEFQKVPYTLTI